jgi:hypothetical protein
MLNWCLRKTYRCPFWWYMVEIHACVLIYRMSLEERSIHWEVSVSVILSTKLYMYLPLISNGFRDGANSLYSIMYSLQTSNTPCPHTSCKVTVTVEFSKKYYAT